MRKYVLVDTNVIIDLLNNDSIYGDFAERILKKYAESHILAINPIIYAELAINYENYRLLDQAISLFQKLPMDYEAAFLAGKAYIKYRQKGGNKLNTLPDFFIGAHASHLKIPLISRDIKRYKTYFPQIKLISET